MQLEADPSSAVDVAGSQVESSEIVSSEMVAATDSAGAETQVVAVRHRGTRTVDPAEEATTLDPAQAAIASIPSVSPTTAV